MTGPDRIAASRLRCTASTVVALPVGSNYRYPTDSAALLPVLTVSLAADAAPLFGSS